MHELLTGLGYVPAGLKLVCRPGIRLYVLIPLLINTLIFTAIIIFGANQLNAMIEGIVSRWEWLDWTRWLLWPVFLIICLTIVFFCFSVFANLVCAPFNGFLAGAVESALTGNEPGAGIGLTQLPAEIVSAMKSESIKFIYFMVRALPLLVLFLIPLIQLIAPVLWFLFCAWMLALEYLDYPLGNNSIDFSNTRQLLAKHKGLVLGFGIGVMIITMIPVINFIAIPVAVSGATILWVKKINTGITQG
jgi:CysZ protein